MLRDGEREQVRMSQLGPRLAARIHVSEDQQGRQSCQVKISPVCGMVGTCRSGGLQPQNSLDRHTARGDQCGCRVGLGPESDSNACLFNRPVCSRAGGVKNPVLSERLSKWSASDMREVGDL